MKTRLFSPLLGLALTGLLVTPLLSGCGSGNASKPGSASTNGANGKSPTTAQNPRTATGVAPANPGAPFVRPDKVRGIYLTAWSAGLPKKMDSVYAMMQGSVLNSVVIDIRDEGQMYWKTGIAIADDSGATTNAVAKPKELFDGLHAHHIYPIARIACFRDNYVTRKHPERAIQDTSGHFWRDHHGNSWLDPYNKDNWEYIAQTVDFALNQGFPEIQLDYVRFPDVSKKNVHVCPSRNKFGWNNTAEEDVIAAFVQYIKEKVKKRGAYISADIFGIISANKSAHGIGQQLEKLAAPLDAISPMVYPSHFRSGEYNIDYPNAHPYEILTKSLGDFKRRVQTPIRPWLQDFSLKIKGKPTIKYGEAEVRAQIKAAHDLGIDEFLMWNAANHYTAAAYH